MFSNPLFWALLGGVLPALLWLWFWLHQDKKRPEPRGRIIATFVLGMLSTLAVLPVEKAIKGLIGANITMLVLLWAFAEELFKYIASYFAGLHSRANNEPIDPIIYLITAALGFAAMENALFLLTPLEQGLIFESIITGNMRFIGATVLHTLSSGVMGAIIGFAFYKKKYVKKLYVPLGLILATALHSIFNFLIINGDGNVFKAFFFVWIAVGILLFLFEKAKHLRPPGIRKSK